jgi:hypothetical protein
MFRKKCQWVLFSLICVSLVSGCSLPFAGSPSPTPFVFPTANATETALAMPTATEAPTQTPWIITATPLPATDTPTATPVTPTATSTEAPTAAPAATAVPGGAHLGPQTEALYVGNEPSLDGGWGDWDATEYSANSIVWGASNWTGADDLSASYKVEWDEDYLYICAKVTDDIYVQTQTGNDLYKGDSIEVLFDSNYNGDYYTNFLNSDDYQIGVSAGKSGIGDGMEAYLWFPSNRATSTSSVLYGAKAWDKGYRIAAAIPWSILRVTPSAGQHYGFVFSVSDDDSNIGGKQQTLTSSDPYRNILNPMSWGDLVLVK